MISPALKGFPKSYGFLSLHDYVQNKRFAHEEKIFLITRFPTVKPFFYDVFLNWLQLYHPPVRARFFLQPLPPLFLDWSRVILHIPWMQDPVQKWSPFAFKMANRFSEECKRRNIPIVNEVQKLSNAGKTHAASAISKLGIRTPKMKRIEDRARFLKDPGFAFPFLIREDWGHKEQIVKVDGEEDLVKVDLRQFERPIAVEFIDVRSPRDGLYRKYRYVIAGDRGTSQSLLVNKDWFTTGNLTINQSRFLEEEKEYLSLPNPDHEQFLKISKAIDLDYLAFDYSYDPEGKLVVWEANPYPAMILSRNARPFRNPYMFKIFASLVDLYHQKANLKTPESILRGCERVGHA